jgi:hypothetical protein
MYTSNLGEDMGTGGPEGGAGCGMIPSNSPEEYDEFSHISVGDTQWVGGFNKNNFLSVANRVVGGVNCLVMMMMMIFT